MHFVKFSPHDLKSYIPDAELNVYKDILKKMNSRFHMRVSIISLEDVVQVADTSVHQLYVMFCSDQNMQRSITEVRVYSETVMLL